MEPLVSILIPAYNAERWIGETLRSAVAQSWARKEIIVVDDGSTDRTPYIARQFERYGVQIVTQRNQRAAAARNNAFDLSKGDFIQWLDADDLLSPNKIAHQLEEARKVSDTRTLFSCAWGRFMFRHRRARFVPTALWTDLSPVEWLLRKMRENIFMQPSTWLVSRELSEAAGPWNTSLLGDDDGEYFCRVLLASHGVKFVKHARVYYRVSGVEGLSYIGQSDRKIRAHWRSMKLHIGYLRSLEDSHRVREACLRYLQTSLFYFYPDSTDILNEAERIAQELGGQLEIPSLSWKYSWMVPLFGYRHANRARFRLPGMKQHLMRYWDELLFQYESRHDPYGSLADL
jgi:glycosyltransferase involved in cell wall biosynthesis